MSNARLPSRRWRYKLCAVLLSTLSACATNSPPLASLPPRPLQIPKPPVTLGPQHTKRELPAALDYSKKVSTWLDDLQLLMTPEPPKSEP